MTDQGYLYEPDVVWEHLAGVDGDTELVNASFRPFAPHGRQEEPQAAGAGGARLLGCSCW